MLCVMSSKCEIRSAGNRSRTAVKQVRHKIGQVRDIEAPVTVDIGLIKHRRGRAAAEQVGDKERNVGHIHLIVQVAVNISP